MPRTRFRLLVYLFTRRFFENDLLAPDIDLRPSAIFGLVLLMTPTFLWAVKAIVRYGLLSIHGYEAVEALSWFDKSLFVTLAIVAAGIVTLVCWDALLVDRRDAVVLGPLPLGRWTIVAAKGAAMLRTFAAVAALNLPAAVIFSVAVYSHFSGGLVVRALAAHALVTTAASLATCLVLTVLLVGVSALLAGRALRVTMVALQAGIVMGLAALLFGLQWTPLIGYAAGAGEPTWVGWLAVWPPLWFVGVYQVVLGSGPGSAVFEAFAWRALVATGVAVVIGIPLTLALWHRSFTLMLTTVPSESTSRWRIGAALVSLLLRRPFDRAMLQFSFAVLARSPRHRLTMLAAAGTVIALAVQGTLILVSREPGTPRWLTEFAVPVLSLFVLLGTVRWLLALPAELAASWPFALRTPAPARDVRRVIQRLCLVVVAVPVAVLALVLSWWQAGALAGAAHAVAVLLGALVLIELSLARVTYFPFAAEYVVDRGNLKARWPVHVFVLLWIVPLVTAAERLLLADPGAPFLVAAAVAGIAVLAGRHRRRRSTDVLETETNVGAEWRAIELRLGPI